MQGITNAKEKAYDSLCEELPPTSRLVPFIRLITVPELKRRYDTTFFVLGLEPYCHVNFMKYAENNKNLH